MNIVIGGCREGMYMEDLLDGIDESGFFINFIIHGNCPNLPDHRRGRSVDMLAREYAEAVGIRSQEYNAKWELGDVAGPSRNVEMVNAAEGCLAIWDNKSDGTRSLITEARRIGLRTHIFVPKRYR